MGTMGMEAAAEGLVPVLRLEVEVLPGLGATGAPELVLGSLAEACLVTAGRVPEACLLTVGRVLALLVLLARGGTPGLGAAAARLAAVVLSCLELAGLVGRGWLWPTWPICPEPLLLLRCSLATEEGWKGSRPGAAAGDRSTWSVL
jgi:hypothetical protein